MWEESSEQQQPLRTGLTTGTCATACALASARHLLLGAQSSSSLASGKGASTTLSVVLPKDKVVELDVVSEQLNDKTVRSKTIKDAGDDPDVTHGATIFVDVTLQQEIGVTFKAASGVGTVTRDGLSLAVGEPAINPVPRQMIIDNLAIQKKLSNYSGGFQVSIGVENGEEIAQKTMNGRLGILGGLSILGTTGIVRPFSCAAWIASIHQGIDVAKANGLKHIAASTGNSSEQAIKAKYQLEEMALIEMGDFSGAVLKHLKKKPIDKLSICGGFGKVTKLANGHMDLNSRVSAVDFNHIAEVAASVGADATLQASIKQANTTIEALKFCQQQNIPLADAMCVKALAFAETIVPKQVAVEVFAINRQGDFVGYAGGVTAQ
ncbi:MAG: cobalt-precorrin-5B (C1)-methyltransferase [Oceanicoccus sp.]|jgi:cobalt-precorrin-5B (C1)-methyltransferase